MKTGRTLQQLAAELDRQNKAKRDFLVDTRELTLLTAKDEDGKGGTSELHVPNGVGEFPVLTQAHRQISSRLDIPAKFYERIRGDHPALLDHNVNTLFRERPERRMVRALDYGGEDRNVRAFLSDRYLRRDNAEVAEAALKVLNELPEVHIPSCEVTDKYMFMTATCPQIEGEVTKGDVVRAGLRLRNSETGHGALTIEPIIYRLWCDNGCGTWVKTRIFHLGAQLDSDEVVRVLSDETLAKDDEAFFAKLQDVMRAAVDETKFNQFLAQMRLATETEKMVKPQLAMEELGAKFDVSEGEQQSILGHLIEGGDLTCYGALNAVTRFAQDVDSYERSMELEEVGGRILQMAGTKDWTRVALTD